MEAPTLGSVGLWFSRVTPPTFSAAHTDLEYSENHARDGGPPSHCIYVATGSTDFGNREKETGEFSGVPFGFRALGSGVACGQVTGSSQNRGRPLCRRSGWRR